MYKYVIFKIDNNYYLYNANNDIITCVGDFQKVLNYYYQHINYKVKYFAYRYIDFNLYIKKF